MGVQGAGRCVRGVHGAGGVCKDGAKGGCVQRAREACKRRARCWRGRSAAGACKGRARLGEGAAGGWAERPGARARGVQGSVIRARGVQGAHKARLGGAKGRATGVQRACKAQCGAAGGGRGGGRLHNPPLVSHVGPRVSPCPWGRAGVLVQKEGSPCKWRGPRANGGVPVCVCAPPCPRGRANRRVPIVAPPHARVPVHVLVQAVQIRAQMSPPLRTRVCVCVCPPTCVLVAVQTVVSAHGRVLVQIAVSPSLSPRVPPCPCGRANRSAPP